MFERLIQSLLEDEIQKLVADDAGKALLRRQMDIPGMKDAELDKLVTYITSDEGRPHVIHQFARKGTKLPMWSIVLEKENQVGDYIGEDIGHDPDLLAECDIILDELSRELGFEVDAKVARWQFVYQLYTYSEHPDVTLALYKVARNTMFGSRELLQAEGVEEPLYSGTDLIPDPRYLADNVFTRQLTITFWSHVLVPTNVNLGPLATGRGKTVAGVHVNDNVIGVTAGVDPYIDGEDDGEDGDE